MGDKQMTRKAKIPGRRAEFFLSHKPLLFEFLRYVAVGGLAFIVDFGVLYFARTFLFPKPGVSGVILATACGFAGGLVTNYVLSSLFVFKKVSEGAKRHKLRSFVIFTVTCLIGLGLTELLMYAGVRLAGEGRYLLVKCFTAGIVLLWNYGSKKIFVFQRRTKW
jgi:putative flippase GtrA